MSTTFARRVTWTMECMVCKDQVVDGPKGVAAGLAAGDPELPFGWRVVDGQLVCSKHHITIGEHPVDPGAGRFA